MAYTGGHPPKLQLWYANKNTVLYDVGYRRVVLRKNYTLVRDGHALLTAHPELFNLLEAQYESGPA